jgi:hypothetical protein
MSATAALRRHWSPGPDPGEPDLLGIAPSLRVPASPRYKDGIVIPGKEHPHARRTDHRHQ